MTVKRGILTNTTMSTDCEAAKKAAGVQQHSFEPSVANGGLELGEAFTENPLFKGCKTLPNESLGAGDADTLLTSIQATIQEYEQRAQEQEERAQLQERLLREQQESIQSLERRINENHQTPSL